MKTSHIIKVNENEIEVIGTYSEEQPDTYETKGVSASFEISSIIYKGVNVYSLMADCGTYIEQLEIIILNQIYNHNYSL